ncbi:DEAD/DEAH box helicase [Lactobacillus delbrueckii]|uniref:DEAD/DEAH box helicase n=1 Tax=Lactobacillus delbrueckii TaxID=1584 RepID=UPI0021A40358|nr:DEAD/DEAH box helicase [Lactobacillus delbrueckii]MCT3508247.1 DEAD/DEAH box helicase [Lactobacillus delbrueckii subsp. bulgaricus]MCT3511003.1 DEAD/DEAH box helicase [Lactobacillus delbrueckii subsp. bulgaricus]MCT3511669.1 DEAD/DEAH box helicase [Lactobacillus delbrueckii subsp. bulgaricus]
MPGENVRVQGKVVKSHLTSFVSAEELRQVQAAEELAGLPVHQKPYAFVTLKDWELVAGHLEKNLPGAIVSFEAAEGVLPWLAKEEGGRLKQIFGQEVPAGKVVTLTLSQAGRKGNWQLQLDGVIMAAQKPNDAKANKAAEVKGVKEAKKAKKTKEVKEKTESFAGKMVDAQVKLGGQTLPLHDYQLYSMNFIMDHPYCGIFLDIGLGKTLTTLAALAKLREEGMKGHILVIAPKTVAKSTWQDEIDKWNLPFKTQSFLTDEKGRQLTPAGRQELYEAAAAKAAKGDWQLYFASRDLVSKLVDLGPWLFKNVVIDESQSFKSPASQRFKALKSVRGRIQRLIELTGTPAPNSFQDLWSQIYLLDQGERLGRSITAYRQQYFEPTLLVNNHPVKWRLLPGSEEKIYQAIDDIVISMKNTRLKLPELTESLDWVEMPPRAKKSYQQLKKDQVLDLPGQEISAENAAVLAGRLRQLASGAIYEEDGEHYQEIFAEKIESCFYLTSNTATPSLVAYYFKSDASRLLAFYRKNGVKAELFDGSPGMIRRWNKGKIPVMLVQPASAGAGLNLQEGGHTLIWFTLPWSLEQYQQMNGRLYRQGQKKPVIIHHLLTKGTIDRHVLDSLKKKDLSQQALLAAVRRTLA